MLFGKIKTWWEERNLKYPPNGWAHSANEEVAFTPDMADLQSSGIQLLFLPCELQSTHQQGKLTYEGGTPMFKGFTRGEFTLYRDMEKASVILVNEPRNSVKGELWAIKPSHFSVLDKYKANEVGCERRRIEIRIPFTRFVPENRTFKGQQEFVDISAWAYIYPLQHWNKELDGGYRYPRVRLFWPNNSFLKPFFYFKPDELKQ